MCPGQSAQEALESYAVSVVKNHMEAPPPAPVGPCSACSGASQLLRGPGLWACLRGSPRPKTAAQLTQLGPGCLITWGVWQASRVSPAPQARPLVQTQAWRVCPASILSGSNGSFWNSICCFCHSERSRTGSEARDRRTEGPGGQPPGPLPSLPPGDGDPQPRAGRGGTVGTCAEAPPRAPGPRRPRRRRAGRRPSPRDPRRE